MPEAFEDEIDFRLETIVMPFKIKGQDKAMVEIKMEFTSEAIQFFLTSSRYHKASRGRQMSQLFDQFTADAGRRT